MSEVINSNKSIDSKILESDKDRSVIDISNNDENSEDLKKELMIKSTIIKFLRKLEMDSNNDEIYKNKKFIIDVLYKLFYKLFPSYKIDYNFVIDGDKIQILLENNIINFIELINSGATSVFYDIKIYKELQNLENKFLSMFLLNNFFGFKDANLLSEILYKLRNEKDLKKSILSDIFYIDDKGQIYGIKDGIHYSTVRFVLGLFLRGISREQLYDMKYLKDNLKNNIILNNYGSNQINVLYELKKNINKLNFSENFINSLKSLLLNKNLGKDELKNLVKDEYFKRFIWEKVKDKHSIFLQINSVNDNESNIDKIIINMSDKELEEVNVVLKEYFRQFYKDFLNGITKVEDIISNNSFDNNKDYLTFLKSKLEKRLYNEDINLGKSFIEKYIDQLEYYEYIDLLSLFVIVEAYITGDIEERIFEKFLIDFIYSVGFHNKGIMFTYELIEEINDILKKNKKKEVDEEEIVNAIVSKQYSDVNVELLLKLLENKKKDVLENRNKVENIVKEFSEYLLSYKDSWDNLEDMELKKKVIELFNNFLKEKPGYKNFLSRLIEKVSRLIEKDGKKVIDDIIYSALMDINLENIGDDSLLVILKSFQYFVEKDLREYRFVLGNENYERLHNLIHLIYKTGKDSKLFNKYMKELILLIEELSDYKDLPENIQDLLLKYKDDLFDIWYYGNVSNIYDDYYKNKIITDEDYLENFSDLISSESDQADQLLEQQLGIENSNESNKSIVEFHNIISNNSNKLDIHYHMENGKQKAVIHIDSGDKPKVIEAKGNDIKDVNKNLIENYLRKMGLEKFDLTGGDLFLKEKLGIDITKKLEPIDIETIGMNFSKYILEKIDKISSLKEYFLKNYEKLYYKLIFDPLQGLEEFINNLVNNENFRNNLRKYNVFPDKFLTTHQFDLLWMTDGLDYVLINLWFEKRKDKYASKL